MIIYFYDNCTAATTSPGFNVRDRGRQDIDICAYSSMYDLLDDDCQKILTQRQNLLNLLSSLEKPMPLFKLKPQRIAIGVREREQSYLRRLHQRL